MPTLELTIISGQAKGKKFAYSSSPVTFGRDVSNVLVVPDDIISRRHGEIRLDHDKWLLVNLSSNGTRINKTDADEPQELADGDIISVAGQKLFRVGLLPDEDAEELTDSRPAASRRAPTKIPTSRRAKIWISIGILWVVVFGAIIFFGTLSRQGGGPTTSTLVDLTDKQIADEIMKEYPKKIPPDARIAADRLAAARPLATKANTNPNLLYEALDAYKVALSYMPDRYLPDPADASDAKIVRDKLIQEVQRAYREGLNRAANPDQSAKAFQKVTELFPSRQSTIYDNALNHWEDALKRKKRPGSKVPGL